MEMSVPRMSSSASPQRIQRKPVSPPQNFDQDVPKEEESPVRGRKMLSGVPHKVQIKTAQRSPVRVHVEPHEWSYPTGYAAEINDDGLTNSRRFSFGEEFQNDLWSPQPPQPPPHVQGIRSASPRNNQNFLAEELPIPGNYPASSQGGASPSQEVRRPSPTPNRDIYGDTFYTTAEEEDNMESIKEEEVNVQPLHYHHIPQQNMQSAPQVRHVSTPPVGRSQPNSGNRPNHLTPFAQHVRQRSGNSFSDFGGRGRSPGGLGHIPQSPGLRVSSQHSRASLDNRSRPSSYVELNSSYPQPSPIPVSLGFSNSALRTAVGTNASLLSTEQTLEMYRKNVSKTHDPETQYAFAIVLIEAAQEAGLSNLQNSSSESLAKKSEAGGKGGGAKDLDSPYADLKQNSARDLLRQAQQVLKKLADNSYPYAQYYLADGYASGLFSKGKPDNEKAFQLFIAASKHGHAESGYRAALCYEFGWGCKKDPTKAVQFYRQSASKNHPGAMTRLGRALLFGELGQVEYREGLKWLRRAQESADTQYPSAPYDLGCLYENGYGEDIFKDEAYAAQLFTQAADLGNVDAAYKLGDAYERGTLSCPKDPALSVHFYTAAAQRGDARAMMSLSAWYICGAEPVLDMDHEEAFEWAKKAAEHGFAKGEYAVGFFTEMGIGTRADPMEANVWYVRAADHGDKRAKNRLSNIYGAAEGEGFSNKRKTKGNKLNSAISNPNLNSSSNSPRKLQSRSNPNLIASAGTENSETNDPKNSTAPNQHLTVPTNNENQKSGLGESDTPHVVTSGGPRFSLGESPQRPKRGVLRKKPMHSSSFGEDGEDMIVVGTRDLNLGEKGGAPMSKEKKDKDKSGGWFSGLWN